MFIDLETSFIFLKLNIAFFLDFVVKYDLDVFLTGVVKFTHLLVFLSTFDENKICRSQYGGNNHVSKPRATVI